MAESLRRPDSRIDPWSLEFVAPPVEQAFAARSWPAVSRQARAGVAVVAVAFLVFSYPDLLFFGLTGRFLVLFAGRLSVALLGALVIAKASRRERPPRFHAWLSLWTLAAVLLAVALPASRPAVGPQLHGLITMVGIVAVYQVVPLRFRDSLAIAMAMSLLYLVVISAHSGFGYREHVITGLATLCANAFGIVTSRWLHRLRRLAWTAQQEAEQANAAKSLFLAMMSHELRTPLHSITTCAQLLESATLSTAEQRHLALLQMSAQSMRHLTDELLDLSRVESGHLALAPAPFDPRRLLDEVAALARVRARARDLDLSYSVDQAVPPALLGDGARIRQVLVNLVENAVKFGEAGTLTLALRPDSTGLRFDVTNPGRAIPVDERATLFEPFVRGVSSREGSGLGLAICRRLVEAMGGAIGVEAAEGGNRFWFTLALAAAADAPVAPPPAAPASPLSLLLVEDDPVSREVTAALLTRDGHQVAFAHDGAAGVELVRQQRFDAVILDVRLPVLDGREAARRIRALPDPARATPLIALTANLMRGENDSFAGFDRVLGKPIDRPALDEALAFAAARRAPLVDERLIGEHSNALTPQAVGAISALFLETSRATLASLRAAVETREPGGIARAAHRLASAALSLGMVCLGEEAARLETAARTGRTPGGDELAAFERLYRQSASRLGVLASLDGHADAVTDAVHRQDDPRDH